jgi:VWFA-related protein
MLKMSLGLHVPVAVGCLALGALGLAAPQTATPPAPAATPSQEPTFRSAVTAVTTDVITRDGGGRFVSDLTKDDFTVLEDGQPQTITSFALVHGGRTYTGLAAPEMAPAPEGIVLPKARRAVENVAGRVVVVFIDDVHIEAEYTPHVKRIVDQLVQELLHDGDLVAMMSSGPSSIATGLTYDRKLVAASVSRIRGSGLTAQEIFRNLEGAQGPVDLRNRAQQAFYSAYGLLGDLEGVQNKRKVLVYISPGYDFDPFAEGRNSKDRIQGGRFSDPLRFLYQNQQDNPYFQKARVNADIDLYQYMRELILTANRTNTTIYAVDPRGLQGISGADQYLDQSEWRTHIQKTQSTLRLMSEATGGFPVVNVNDFPSEFKKIDAETSDYYMLGFTSSNPDPKRRVRELEVKVGRPGVTVSSRKAYSLKPAGPALPGSAPPKP